MKRNLAIVICLLLSTSLAFAQTRTTQRQSVYKTKTMMFYDTSDCYYTPGKYTPQQLENTERMCSGATSYSMLSSFEIKRTAGQTDEQYYQKAKDVLATCELVKGEYWENLRKECLKKLEYEIENNLVQSKAVKDPSVMKTSKLGQYCTEYVDAINGTDEEMMAAWKKLATAQAKNNADPERIMREYRKKATADNRIENGRKELINYGWNNCMASLAAEGKFYKINDNEVRGAFYKLFTKVVEPEP